MSIAARAPGSEHPGPQACPESDDLHAATAAHERVATASRFGDRRVVPPPSRNYPTGQTLPVAALVETYEVARSTARRAVKALRDEGLVYTVPQRGTYVAQPGESTQQAAERQYRQRATRQEVVPRRRTGQTRTILAMTRLA